MTEKTYSANKTGHRDSCPVGFLLHCEALRFGGIYPGVITTKEY